MSETGGVVVLAESDWRARQSAHEARVRAWTDPHQARAARGEKHPVYDFLFTYYAFRPAWLRRWHPGPDVALAGEGAREFLRWPEYREIEGDTGILPDVSPGWRSRLESGRDFSPCKSIGGTEVPPTFGATTARRTVSREMRPSLPVDSGRASDHGQNAHATANAVALDSSALPERRREFVAWLRALLSAMQTRPAFFGCFGLHEWAMVYRQTPDEVRHNAWPLRHPPDALAAIVEAAPITCSHFDAFRFFTVPARPLNRLQPTRAESAQWEQRGCLHANMDLYKWASKLAPFSPSEMIADAFELARDIREVDMRASPYDLRALGFEPIAIETPAGRTEYERHQRAFTARGEPLRARLLALCARLLD